MHSTILNLSIKIEGVTQFPLKLSSQHFYCVIPLIINTTFKYIFVLPSMFISFSYVTKGYDQKNKTIFKFEFTYYQ